MVMVRGYTRRVKGKLVRVRGHTRRHIRVKRRKPVRKRKKRRR